MRIGSRLAVLAAVAAIGCTTIQTEYAEDLDADLSGRKTFSIEKAETPSEMDPGAAQAWSERRQLIRGLIRDELTAKGYQETGENPDLRVHFFAVRGYDFRQEHHFPEQRGMIDIRAADPASGEWLWHGWAKETLTERQDEEAEIRKAVPMILSRFPSAS